MKKYINGRVYDTSTAKKCGEIDRGYRSSYDWYHEELYLKKTGEFFLWGEGHAASKYCTYCQGGGSDPGENIIPITYDVAKEWAEKHLEPDKYDEIFGEITENAESISLHLSLSKAAYDKAKRNAQIKGISVSKYIEQLIEHDK